MRKLKKIRMRKGAFALACTIALGTLIVPMPAALAATCTASAGATFEMVGGLLTGGGCSDSTGDPIDTVNVTAAGTYTFNLSGGDFINSEGVTIEFVFDTTPGKTIVINGTEDKQEISLRARGIDLNIDGTREIVPDTATDPLADMSDTGVQTVTADLLGGGDVLTGTGVGDDFPANLDVDGGDGNDILVGGDGNDVINGDAGRDHLEGGLGDDQLFGGEGVDTFDTHLSPDGADLMDGEGGSDRVSYTGRDQSITATLAPTAGTGDDGEQGEGDDLVNVERVFGSDFDDVIDASAYVDPAAPKVFLFGNDGSDTLTGGDGNDRLFGGDHTDTVTGGPGNDRIDGGAGDDTENGDAGKDTFIQGGSANGADTLTGGADNDTVKYTARSTKITLTPGAGGDGGPGEDDTVSTDIERVFGGSAGDELQAGVGDHELVGRGGNDELRGGDGNDELRGGAGNDELFGEGGNDRLFGGPGKDDLDGGVGGNDFGNGGTGSDSCVELEKKKSCP
jgi:Ca2+-binding RTX toxin-like protein